MKFKYFFLAISILLFALTNCNTTEPPDNNNDQDTTNHNFTFQTWTFGDHSSSVLYDVAIVNDTSIWVVGEIYLNDSLGQPDPNAYNLVHWNGIEWKLLRLQFYTFCGQPYTGSYPTRSIIAFSESDIWITSGSQITSYDGENQSVIECIPVSVNKLWGTDKNNLYAVGFSGQVAHYQNGSWINIESGADLDIYDIWGDYNSTIGGYEIIAIAAKEFVTYDKKIFRITGNSVQNISTDSIPYSIHGVWFKSEKKYFISGDGLYSKNKINSTTEWEWLHNKVTNYYLYAIRGQQTNDLFTCGAFGEMIHYNGSTWRSYIEETGISNGAFNSITLNQNIIVAVGYNNPKSVITMGRR